MSFYRKYGKRIFDLCLTIPAFVVLSPVMGVTAVLVAVKLGRPVLFTQKRPGYQEKIFRMYKFRSMTDERDKDGNLLPDEVRLTPFGEKLRSTSLDELPELLNILKGDMSLVGTRPPTMDEYNQYELHHKSRLAAKPGLTGMWQVSGRSDFTDFEEIVKMDSDYIKNWNIGLDIKIILKTVLVVLGQKGSV